jgi:predicted Zn-dependent peptidase
MYAPQSIAITFAIVNPETGVLSNGMRVVHQRVSSPMAHCALMIDCGSRDELPQEHGIAHFIEHCVFKGTTHRRAHQILSSLDAVGGELNAYTTKEETVVHASFPQQYLTRATDVILDLVFNPLFPDKELEKEKDVVIDEIQSYQDDPAEQIQDDFEDLLFADHPLGRNILGTATSVSEFTRTMLLQFVARHYHPGRMVFSSAGNFSMVRLVRLLEKRLEAVQTAGQPVKRMAFSEPKPFRVKQQRTIFQAHAVIGNLAYNVHDERRVAAAMLNNLLAGPPMNTRLGMEIREKRGIAYTIESTYHPFTDTGLLNVYFGTAPQNVDKTIRLIMKEFDKLCQTPLKRRELDMVRRQVMGQLMMAIENNNAVMLGNARTLMLFNHIDPFEVVMEKVRSVTEEDLLQAARHILDPERQSFLAFIP